MEVTGSYSQPNLKSTKIPTKRVRAESLEEEESDSKKRLMSADEFCFSFEDLNRQLYSKHGEEVEKKEEVSNELDFCFWCDAKRFQEDFECPYHENGTKSSPKKKTNQDQGIPEILKLFKMSTDKGEMTGIQAAKPIPAGAWIGPYEGKLVKLEQGVSVKKNEYMWEIFKDGKLHGFIDGSDESSSSWMRFIRCARHEEEQNLYAFQYMNKIYYRTYKTIEPGQELLVWYDQMYTQYMGIPCEGIYDMASANAGTCHLSKTLVETTGDILPLTPPTTPTKSPDDAFTRQSPSLSPTSQFPACATLYVSRAPGSSLQPIKSLEFQEDQVIGDQNDTRERAFRCQPIKINDPRRSPNQNTDMQISITSMPCSVNSDTTMASVQLSSGLPANTDQNNDSNFTALNASNSSPPPIRVKLGAAQPRSVGPKATHFQCGQCEKVFIQRSVLQTHVCAGVLLKPYQCGHCNKTFSNPGLMRLHAVTHQGKKPFKCGYCMRSFSGATTLNNHIRTHTGEKPFDCSKCGKCFTKGLQLSRHHRMPGACAP